MIPIKKSKAFTLIELMVVVAIIGILSAIITANLATSKSKARDAKRISDLASLQLAMELYFDRCNQYPTAASGMPDITSTAGCPTTPVIKLSTFISQIPVYPTPGSAYAYDLKGDYSDYVLKAVLENSSSLDRFIGTSPFDNTFVCNGTTDYCVQPR